MPGGLRGIGAQAFEGLAVVKTSRYNGCVSASPLGKTMSLYSCVHDHPLIRVVNGGLAPERSSKGFLRSGFQMRHVGGLESDTRLHERATTGSVGLESRARWLKIVWTTRCDGMAPGSIVKRNSFCYG